MTPGWSWLLVVAVGVPWTVGATFLVLGAIHAVDVAVGRARSRRQGRSDDVLRRLRRRVDDRRAVEGASVSWGRGGRR